MSDDIMKNMCVNQGYVPATCTMPGRMVFALMHETGDPCVECNEDRSKCKGRPKENVETVN